MTIGVGRSELTLAAGFLKGDDIGLFLFDKRRQAGFSFLADVVDHDLQRRALGFRSAGPIVVHVAEQENEDAGNVDERPAGAEQQAERDERDQGQQPAQGRRIKKERECEVVLAVIFQREEDQAEGDRVGDRGEDQQSPNPFLQPLKSAGWIFAVTPQPIELVEQSIRRRGADDRFSRWALRWRRLASWIRVGHGSGWQTGAAIDLPRSGLWEKSALA